MPNLKLKKIMPAGACSACDVCCKFLDKKSTWAPVFLPFEITTEIKPYLYKSGRVRLKLSSLIYICPFFDKPKNKCTKYAKRPFDCRIYPFTVTFDECRESIVLGIDTKCPFARDPKNKNAIKEYSEYLAGVLERKTTTSLICENPLFIGNFHNDIIKLSQLSALTKSLVSSPVKNGFKKLSLKDKAIFDNAGESFVNLYIWQDINPVWWRKEGGKIKMLLETNSGYADFDSVKKFPDYVYLQKDLAELKGKKYRHKRASCNHFVKNYAFQYLPYKENMKNECLRLFSEWAVERKKKFNDPYYHQLLKDSSSAHKTALENHRALGLTGRVIKIKNKIRAYTFGFEGLKDTFCVLLEVTDLKFKGISEFIFREFSKEMSGYKYINTMDDSGLENLRIAKLSYYPLAQHI